MNTNRFVLTCLMLAAGITMTAPGARAAETRPNILFIIFDDWSREHAGAYGCDWVKTPNFDRLAREGVLFTNAFTSNPKCSPCRASILTGRNSWQLEEAACHNGLFPSKFAVYPDLLERAGYSVGLTGKGWGPGDFRTTGFKRNPAGPSFDQHKTQPPASGIGRNDYARNFQAFLEDRPKVKPFCFWMGFSEPHRGYELNSGQRMGKNLEDVTVPPFLPDVPQVRSDLADYSIEVEYADSHIGRALELLEESGELENTLVIATSDHGMPFPFVKGQIFDDGFHLPLAMRWGKGIKPGRVVDDFVNVRDLAPTYLELAGVEAHEQMTGKSLVDVLRADKSGWVDRDRNMMLIGKERHDIGRPNDLGYPVRAIRTPEYFYVHNYFPDRWPACNPETDFGNCDASPTKEIVKLLGGHFYDLAFGKRPSDMLFRLSDDPRCVRNLAHDPAFAPVMNELRNRMLNVLKNEQDPRALGNGDVFDTYKYLGGRAKGYETWLAAQHEKISAELSKPKNNRNSNRNRASRP
jgi:arylsulfatase A-like enzyme